MTRKELRVQERAKAHLNDAQTAWHITLNELHQAVKNLHADGNNHNFIAARAAESEAYIAYLEAERAYQAHLAH